MKTSGYRYSGPLTGVTLRLEDGSTSEVMLHDGQTVELPADHGYTTTLVALRRLTPIAPADVDSSTEATS